jgi:DNA-binding LacI/PurR family transcriptional regulator
MKKYLEQRLSHGAPRQTPLAVFVTCDAHLPGVIKAVSACGLHMPEQIVIAGFDDSDLAAHAGVMVIDQPRTQIGFQAVKRLLALMRNPGLPPQQLSLKPRLLLPNTTGEIAE